MNRELLRRSPHLLAWSAACSALAALACVAGTARRSDAPRSLDAPVVAQSAMTLDEKAHFAKNAFPPTLPDTVFHHDTWTPEACLACHAEDIEGVPKVKHAGMLALQLQVSCRTCHVLRTSEPVARGEPGFAPNAFPPVLSNHAWHADPWGPNDCLACHRTGERNAPVVRHQDMAPHLLKAKCRTCHVQAELEGR